MNKLEKIFAGLGILAVVGLTMGAIRASQNDIIFGGNGPIKMISQDGVVILPNSSDTITTGSFVATKDVVAQMINEAQPPPPSETVKRYPFFILDLNDGFSVGEGGSTWLGVELKASTNNFGMMLSEPISSDRHPCFWSCSEVNSRLVDSMDGCMAFVIWQDANSEPGYDNRGWVRIKTSIISFLDTNLGANLILPRKIGILVVPELLVTTAGNTDWLCSDNEEIVWSFMRTDANSYEVNANNNAIWTMCEPACWFSSIPAWANTGRNAE